MNDLNVAPSFFCSEFQMEGINNCWVHALKFSLNFLLINLSLCPKKSVELSDWEEMGHFWETLLLFPQKLLFKYNPSDKFNVCDSELQTVSNFLAAGKFQFNDACITDFNQ